MALCSMLRKKFLNLKKFLTKKGCKRVQSSSRVPRSLSDLVEALRKHVTLLSDFSRKTFDEGDANYLGEIAAKLRLLVWDGGRSNKPLLLKLMRVFEIEVPITLGGPPVQPPPGQPGPGDRISLQEYLDLLSTAIRVPSQGLVEISNLELIRTIAEQHGAAHEDWSHDKTYSTLRGFNLFIGGRPAVEATLLPITSTVLHVAVRFLESLTPSLIVAKNAERQLSYANQKLALDPADSFARQLRGEALVISDN